MKREIRKELILNQIKELLTSTKNFSEIAKKIGVDKNTITKYVRLIEAETGIKIKSRNYSSENKHRVKVLLEENKYNFSEIGDILGITKERVRQLVCKIEKETGVKIERTRVRKDTKEKIPIIKKLLKEGKSIIEISEKLNTSNSVISKVRKEYAEEIKQARKQARKQIDLKINPVKVYKGGNLVRVKKVLCPDGKRRSFHIHNNVKGEFSKKSGFVRVYKNKEEAYSVSGTVKQVEKDVIFVPSKGSIYSNIFESIDQ